MTTQTTEPRPMKPYLINAVLDYCRDTGTTPYVMYLNSISTPIFKSLF